MLGELLRAPARGDWWQEEWVLVPQFSMRRWLQQQLAGQLGICANVRFLTPGEFVDLALERNLGPAPRGDRLLPEPPRELRSYLPHAPALPVTGQIVSFYGSAVTYAAENQVVVLNRGSKDGLERGHIVVVRKNGERLTDSTDSGKAGLKLPNERNGLMMVFRTFEQLSYALVLQINDGVKVGDRFDNPN